MNLYTSDFVKTINGYCNGDDIHFVGLGKYDFQLSFGNLERIQSSHKINFNIKNNSYLWEEGANIIPIWSLIGQVPKKFTLETPEVLVMHLDSGDYVSFYTNEEPHENLIVTYDENEDGIMMDIF